MSYIKLHGVQFNVRNCDVRKGATRDTWSELTVRPSHVHSLDELAANGLFNLSINGMDVISINIHPRYVRGLHKFSVTGLKRLSVNVSPLRGI